MTLRRLYLFMLSILVATIGSGQNVVVSDSLYDEPLPTTPYVEKLTWGDIEYRGNQWIQNMNVPYQPTKGLKGRHLSVTASHGRYYDVKTGKWLWERPALFCTHEDLFTQTFVVPFLMPMLERAGAVVWTPRERSWMREEVVVDNDQPQKDGLYVEVNGQNEWEAAGKGFAWWKEVYIDGENPHESGSARKVMAQNRKRQSSSVIWTPNVPRDGDYAVYVSYPQLSTNVPDAQYVVRHRGTNTTIRVNQQMGGGTWVYLGTFDFSKGCSQDNCVTLTNVSNYQGTVAADALRLGGGMGNIARTDSLKTYTATLSGLPRYLEAARYSAQWKGIPYYIYSVKEGGNDYNDDIIVRPHSSNYMARGSVYLPGDSGLHVPIELELAVHSDAGASRDMTPIGSLAILTSDFEEGLYPSGVSRKAPRKLGDLLLSNLRKDLSKLYGNWVTRTIYDKNYGESRVPRVPGMILEMLSHQNFADLLLGHDPKFKFFFSRSIYKSILRYIAYMHDIKDVVVQPLPVEAMQARVEPNNGRIVVSWRGVNDPLESSAKPTAFVLYQKKGDGGWDNGTVVKDNTYSIDAEAGTLYRFKVEAINDGGASLPSEEMCAYISPEKASADILIVNGFTRLAAPQPVDVDTIRGFDMLLDPGVAYHETPGFSGRQLCFDKAMVGKEGVGALGYCSDEWVGILMKGNTFDYPTQHAQDFIRAGRYNISSCSRKALEKKHIDAGAYRMVDLIMGAQREDGYSKEDFKTFTQELKDVITQYTQRGGRLLVSGAYTGTDMTRDMDLLFTQKILHYVNAGIEQGDSIMNIEGMNTRCSYLMRPNEEHLNTGYVSSLKAEGTAFPMLLYSGSQHVAGVAYQGADYRSITLGFPIEHIREDDVRQQLMQAFIHFLLSSQ